MEANMEDLTLAKRTKTQSFGKVSFLVGVSGACPGGARGHLGAFGRRLGAFGGLGASWGHL